MKLRFCESEIPYWAERYSDPDGEELENELTDKDLVNKVQQQQYLTRDILRKAARWKSPRRAGLIVHNSENDVKEITGYALKSQSERVRWGVLQCLAGVRLPIASATLHFFHEEMYPIADFRAMWSIRVDKNNNDYPFEFWQEYVSFCRDLAKSNSVDMRTLDRALWQYSRENQKRN